MSSSAEPFVRDCYFTPVPDEITAHDLPVAGTLPPQLTGVYLRNGPNPRSGSAHHFMAGDGMVHGVRLEAGQARWYRNRYVKTRRDAGIHGGRSSNTHVFAHAGRILSFVEVALPIELDRRLETVGPVDFGGVDTAFTAHGKIDPGTGELIAFGYQFASPHLTFYRIDRAGQVVERRVIDVGAPCFMHDFAMTERYAVFFDTPAVMVREWGGGGLPFRWQEGRGTRIGVVPRRAARCAGSTCPRANSGTRPTPSSRTVASSWMGFAPTASWQTWRSIRRPWFAGRSTSRAASSRRRRWAAIPSSSRALMSGATAAPIAMSIPLSTAISAGRRTCLEVPCCAATTSRRARRPRKTSACATPPRRACVRPEVRRRRREGRVGVHASL